MKRSLIIILSIVILSTLCLTGSLKATGLEGEIDIINGYRADDLDWNIAGNISGSNPNILSELTFSDLESYQFKLGGRGTINRAFYLRGSVDYAWVLNGEVQDSDFNADNRTQEWSRSISSADDSYLFDATLGIGYLFRLASDKLRVAPLVGYAYSEQNIKLTDGFQTLSLPPQAQSIGPIANLDSRYDTRWHGPWVGLDLSVDAGEKIRLFAGLEYHWADYKAEGFWNLRADPNFEHEADGTGFLISVGGDYAFSGPWSLGLEISYQDWSTDAGIDRQFFAGGTMAETRLNEVNWESYAIMLRVTYRFHYFYRR